MHDDYDRSSKWLIEHHGNSLLYLGGVRGLRSWRCLPADVVQPRQLPDGLLEVYLGDQTEPDLFNVEIATYPETRVPEQMARDSVLVYLARRVLPEVLTLVLRPRGTLRVPDTQAVQSRQGWTELRLKWRVVELWTLPAEQLLAANDVGLIPWVPLTQFDGPPEPVLQQCRQRIDQQAPAEERANLLAVTQVLTRLRYNEPNLLTIFGGSQAMIESPLIQEIVTKTRHEAMHTAIGRVLTERFGTVLPEIMAGLQAVQEEGKLDELLRWAVRCPDLEAFRGRLASEG